MFLQAWAATFSVSFMIHIILVLFGAPISRSLNILEPTKLMLTRNELIICCSLILKTYFLALLISIATVYTPALVLGIPTLDNNSTSVVKRWTWIRLFAELS